MFTITTLYFAAFRNRALKKIILCFSYYVISPFWLIVGQAQNDLILLYYHY